MATATVKAMAGVTEGVMRTVMAMGLPTKDTLGQVVVVGAEKGMGTAMGKGTSFTICRDLIYQGEWQKALRSASGFVEVRYVLEHLLEAAPQRPSQGSTGREDYYGNGFGNSNGCRFDPWLGDGSGNGHGSEIVEDWSACYGDGGCGASGDGNHWGNSCGDERGDSVEPVS